MIELVVKNNKITIVAAQGEGYGKGYEAGKAEGFENGMNAGYNLGINEGKETERNKFWNDFVESREGNFQYAFAYGWDDASYNPPREFVIRGGTYMYRNSKITSTKVPIIIEAGSFDSAFINCSELTTIVGIDFSGAKNTGTLLNNTPNLQHIGEVKGLHTAIGFAPCPLLTDASIENIIKGLDTLPEGSTTKITFATTLKDKFIANGWDKAITNKNWVLAFG